MFQVASDQPSSGRRPVGRARPLRRRPRRRRLLRSHRLLRNGAAHDDRASTARFDEFRANPQDPCACVTVASADAPPASTHRAHSGMATRSTARARSSCHSPSRRTTSSRAPGAIGKRSRASRRVATAVANLKRNVPDPLVTFRTADAVLPPLAFLAPIDAEVVRAERAPRRMPASPSSYEILYERATGGDDDSAVRRARARALRALRAQLARASGG